MPGGWLVGVALAGIALAIYRVISQRRARQSTGSPVTKSAPGTAPQPPPDDAKLYQCANRLESHYHATAQPGDLRGHPVFAEAVAYLNSGPYSSEALLAYASGDNSVILCLALEALALRRDHTDIATPVLATSTRSLSGRGISRCRRCRYAFRHKNHSSDGSCAKSTRLGHTARRVSFSRSSCTIAWTAVKPRAPT